MAGLNKSQESSHPPKPKVLRTRQLFSQQTTPRTCAFSPNSSIVHALNPLSPHNTIDLDSLYEQTSEDCLKIERVCLMQREIERREGKLKEREKELQGLTLPNMNVISEFVFLARKALPGAEIGQENVQDWNGLLEVFRTVVDKVGVDRKQGRDADSLKLQLQEHQNESKNALHQLKFVEQQLEEKHLEVRRLRQAKETAMKELKGYEDKLHRQRKSLEEQLESLERSRNYLDDRDRELEKRGQVADAKETELKRLSTQIQDKQKDFQRLITSKEEALALSERKLHDYQTQLSQKEAEVNIFLAKIERRRQEIESNNELRTKQLDDHAADLDRQALYLSQREADLNKEQDTLKLMQEEFEASKQLFNRKVSERERSLSSIERTLAERRDEVDSSFSELKREMQSIDELKQQVETEKTQYFSRLQTQNELVYREKLRLLEEQRERDYVTVQEYRAQLQKTQAEFEHFKLSDKLQKLQIKQLKTELDAREQRTVQANEPRLKALQEKEAELHKWHSDLLKKERLLLEATPRNHSFGATKHNRRLSREDEVIATDLLIKDRQELEHATYMIEQLHMEIEESKVALERERTALDKDKQNFEGIIEALEAESQRLLTEDLNLKSLQRELQQKEDSLRRRELNLSVNLSERDFSRLDYSVI